MKFENTEVWGFKHALRGMSPLIPKRANTNTDIFLGRYYEYEKDL